MKTSLGFANEKPPKKESRVKSLTIPSFQIEGKKREKIISCSDFAWLFEAERSGSFLAYILLLLTLGNLDP